MIYLFTGYYTIDSHVVRHFFYNVEDKQYYMVRKEHNDITYFVIEYGSNVERCNEFIYDENFNCILIHMKRDDRYIMCEKYLFDKMVV